MENNFNTELSKMDLRLKEMEEKIDAISKKLTQVVDAILGNSLTKTGGFINDIELLKQKIEVLEKKESNHAEFKKQISWTIGILIALGGVVQYVISVYLNLKK
jgi:tetrahydromethanopterin S-methyltransferase subunit G